VSAPDASSDRRRDGEPDRHQKEGDALRVPAAECQRKKHTHDGQDDCQNEEEPASRCGVRHYGWLSIRPQGRLPSLLEKPQQQRHR
jgi:hypothetical protein